MNGILIIVNRLIKIIWRWMENFYKIYFSIEIILYIGIEVDRMNLVMIFKGF